MLFLFPVMLHAQELYSAKKAVKLMGCGFELLAVANSEQLAWDAVEAGIEEISRIEKLISSWDPKSQTSKINVLAGKESVKVDRELFDLIYRAKKISALTKGAFDISFASMDRIWKFDKSEQQMPNEEVVIEARSKVNWQNIVLDKEARTVYLKEADMKIGFGAIGKGYAANRAKKLMANMNGVVGGLVNASGDVIAWGSSRNPNDWQVQIADPHHPGNGLGWIDLQDMAIVTSGNYEKYFMHNGTRYAHIIDPKTGYPTTGITSVSIVCPDTELADALATSVFVLGMEDGLNLINSLNLVEGIIIANDGTAASSDNFNINYN